MSQHQIERNMIVNDGELSMEELESVSGGVFTPGVGYNGRVTPSGNVFTPGVGYNGRVTPSGNVFTPGVGYNGRVTPSGNALS